ncbi:MAG: hypothetical protein J6V42_06380, partial [Clostridia bacterium]|nr:hypothetical protein [Clostridia bacterium]
MKKSVFKSILRGIALLLVLAMIPLALLSCATPDDDKDDKSEKDSATKEEKFDTAQSLLEAGDYAAAYEMFKSLGDYKGADKELQKFRYMPVSITIAGTEDDESYTPNLTFTYRENNLPKRVSIAYDDNDTYSYDYAYDKNGNCTQEIHTNTDGQKSIYDYTYDGKGNLVKCVYTNSDGEKYTYEYTYDNKNNMTKEVHTNSAGNTYTYTHEC